VRILAAVAAISVCALAQSVSSSWADLGSSAWGVAVGVTVDADGGIFAIRRVEPSFFFLRAGKLQRQWGSGLFQYAHGIRVDRNGALWATDAGDFSVVYKMDRLTGEVMMTLGTKGVKGATESTFNRPADVAVSAAGDIFIADGFGNSRVVKYSKDGKFVKAWGAKGTAPGQFNLPHNLVIDSRGRLLVADRENSRIQIFDLDGTFLEQWPGLGGKPYGLAIAADDTLYIGDAEGGTVTVARDGKVVEVIRDLGRPHQLALDKAGAVYFADVREGKGVTRILRR
jgi:DNA-binding beta-propeller fold protein YncE